MAMYAYVFLYIPIHIHVYFGYSRLQQCRQPMWNTLCSHSGQLRGGKHGAQTRPAPKLLTLSSNLGIRAGLLLLLLLFCVKDLT